MSDMAAPVAYMVMVTVKITSDHAQALGTLYERACKLQEGFSVKYKVTVARLVKHPMRPATIERLLVAIAMVLSARGLREDEARTLEAIRIQLRREYEREQRRNGASPVRAAIAAANTARKKLVAAGMPKVALPALAANDGVVVTASRVTAAIRDFLCPRGTQDRLVDWVARTAQLASETYDAFAVEEAARLVELACRWAAERLHDKRAATATLPVRLADMPSHGRRLTLSRGAPWRRRTRSRRTTPPS